MLKARLLLKNLEKDLPHYLKINTAEAVLKDDEALFCIFCLLSCLLRNKYRIHKYLLLNESEKKRMFISFV